MRSRLALILVAAVPASLAACGGSGDPSAGGSVKEFCAAAGQIAARDRSEDPTEALRAFAELEDLAPTASLAKALAQLGIAATALGDFDPADPEAFRELEAVLSEAKAREAIESLETYLGTDCKLPGRSEADSDDLPASGPPPAFGSKVEGADLHVAVADYLASVKASYTVVETTLGCDEDYCEVSVKLTGSGAIDGVALCRATDAWLRDRSDEDRIALRFTREDTQQMIAGYGPGETCEDTQVP